MNVFDFCKRFQYFYSNIQRDIYVQKIEVKNMFFIYYFSVITMTIQLGVTLDREMDSLSFDI